MLQDLPWSTAEKKIARAAFDRAYERECEAIHREVESMLNAARNDARVIWRIEEYLRARRSETDAKYDYRYSVLPLVFGGLLHEGWLTEEDLEGLRPDKLASIRRIASRQ
jgi:hypothetical protein